MKEDLLSHHQNNLNEILEFYSWDGAKFSSGDILTLSYQVHRSYLILTCHYDTSRDVMMMYSDVI